MCPRFDGPLSLSLALSLSWSQLFELTKKEEEEFNQFQQQREKLNYFWIVEKKNLEDSRAELRNKERELQDLEEKHQVEIKVYKQRVKHLLYEHQNEITEAKYDGELTLKLVGFLLWLCSDPNTWILADHFRVFTQQPPLRFAYSSLPHPFVPLPQRERLRTTIAQMKRN